MFLVYSLTSSFRPVCCTLGVYTHGPGIHLGFSCGSVVPPVSISCTISGVKNFPGLNSLSHVHRHNIILGSFHCHQPFSHTLGEGGSQLLLSGYLAGFSSQFCLLVHRIAQQSVSYPIGFAFAALLLSLVQYKSGLVVIIASRTSFRASFYLSVYSNNWFAMDLLCTLG